MAGGTQRLTVGAVVGAASVLALIAPLGAADAPAPRAGKATVRTASTGNDSELLKTIPIGRGLGSKERVVMSLDPGGLGNLQDGDRSTPRQR